MPNFAKVAGPLHRLTRADVSFEWSQDCEESFGTLKELLCTPPTLAYPDFSRPHVDASGKGLGAVLEQEAQQGIHRPIAYRC